MFYQTLYLPIWEALKLNFSCPQATTTFSLGSSSKMLPESIFFSFVGFLRVLNLVPGDPPWTHLSLDPKSRRTSLVRRPLPGPLVSSRWKGEETLWGQDRPPPWSVWYGPAWWRTSFLKNLDDKKQEEQLSKKLTLPGLLLWVTVLVRHHPAGYKGGELTSENSFPFGSQ